MNSLPLKLALAAAVFLLFALPDFAADGPAGLLRASSPVDSLRGDPDQETATPEPRGCAGGILTSRSRTSRQLGKNPRLVRKPFRCCSSQESSVRRRSMPKVRRLSASRLSMAVAIPFPWYEARGSEKHDSSLQAILTKGIGEDVD
jgi:hypothetical protein